jgi:GAF domain-containing protein
MAHWPNIRASLRQKTTDVRTVLRKGELNICILIFLKILYFIFFILLETQQANDEADAAEEDEVVDLLDQPRWTTDEEDNWEPWLNEREDVADDDDDPVSKQALSKSFSGFSLDEN